MGAVNVKENKESENKQGTRIGPDTPEHEHLVLKLRRAFFLLWKKARRHIL